MPAAAALICRAGGVGTVALHATPTLTPAAADARAANYLRGTSHRKHRMQLRVIFIFARSVFFFLSLPSFKSIRDLIMIKTAAGVR